MMVYPFCCIIFAKYKKSRLSSCVFAKKLKDDNEWENLKVCKEKLGITA